MQVKVNSNIVGWSTCSNYAKLGHNRTLNMYVESVNVQNKGVNRVLYGFGGFQSFKTITGKCRGFHVVENCWDGKRILFVCQGYKIYAIDESGTQLEIGTIGVGQDRIGWAEVPIYGADSWLVFVDGHNCYAIDTTTYEGSIHNISLPMRSADDTRIEPNSIAYLYGNLVVNDSKTDAFYTSCYHPLNTYDSVVDFDVFMVDEAPFTDNPTEDDDGARPWYKYGYVSYAEYRGDHLLDLVSNGNKLYAIGETSIQMMSYNNVALSKYVTGGIVWSSPNSSCWNVGCDDYKSVAQWADTFFWVGKSLNGNRQVFTFNNGATAISNPEIEKELATAENFNAFTFMVNGHPFYVLTYNDKTIAYDIRESGWIDLCSLDSKNEQHKFRYNDSVQFGSGLYFGMEGKLVKYTEESFTDCGTPIIRLRAGHIVSDTKILLKELEPIVNTGDGDMELRLNFSNDGKTWKQFNIHYAGSQGDYGFEPLFTDLGEGSNFSIELSTTSDCQFCLKDMELNYEALIY